MNKKILEMYIAQTNAGLAQAENETVLQNLGKGIALAQVFEHLASDLNSLAKEMRELGLDVNIYVNSDETEIGYSINYVVAFE